MRQMKILGVAEGGAKSVKMSTIQNLEAIAHLHWLKKKGLSLDKAIVRTHSVEYAKTPIVQSGHEVIPGSVRVVGGHTSPIRNMTSHYEAGNPALVAQHTEILNRYGLTRDTPMLWDFDIVMNVRPARATGTAPKGN